jgi:uncharacterized protein
MTWSSPGWPSSPVTERPRDHLGRPLPREAQGFPGVPVREVITADEATMEGADYLRRGLPFHAHEVFEMRWRCCPEIERPLWRGLAQAAAGATHVARGNPVGAERLLDRGQETIATYDGPISPAVRAIMDVLWRTPTA